MKNRLSQYNLSEEDAEDYEDWADALFELVFGITLDVGTLVYGPSPTGSSDFGLKQTPAQIARLKDSGINDRYYRD